MQFSRFYAPVAYRQMSKKAVAVLSRFFLTLIVGLLNALP